MMSGENRVKINRAPVMTLWGIVVSERLGFDEDAALTLGKAVAGLNAQSKGRRLGIFEESIEDEIKKIPKERKPGEQLNVELLGRMVPALQTDLGIRATAKGEPINPDSVRRYLEKKFGQDLGEVQAAMQVLANNFPPDVLNKRAYALYEKFRPEIPEGTKGWGAAGDLDLKKIRSLAEGKDVIYKT
jgi:hypothetical protein